MADIIGKLKVISLNERKARGPLASFTTFVISEVETVGKSNGNRATTDAEAISVIRKMIAKNESSIEVSKDADKVATLKAENAMLESVMPSMASEETVRIFLVNKFANDAPSNKGVIMKALRDEFGALVDMKSAGAIAAEIYGV